MNYGHKDHEHHDQRDNVKLETAPGAPDHDKKGISVTLRGDMQAFIDERVDEHVDACLVLSSFNWRVWFQTHVDEDHPLLRHHCSSHGMI